MSEVIVLEFNGATAEQYHAVNAALGIDMASGGGEFPAGLRSHTGAHNGDTLIVVEEWDSQAAQAAFMQARLGPALGQVGVPEPIRVEWLTTLGSQHIHSH
jgi:hypothetical protein